MIHRAKKKQTNTIIQSRNSSSNSLCSAETNNLIFYGGRCTSFFDNEGAPNEEQPRLPRQANEALLTNRGERQCAFKISFPV